MKQSLNYNELKTDILEEPCDAFCITTNGFVKSNGDAVMGKGIAKQIQDYIPNIPSLLGKSLYTKGNHTVILVQEENKPIVISLPVKPSGAISTGDNVVKHMKHQFPVGKWTCGWACKADLNIIERSIQELVELVNQTDWTKVLLPRVGCGAGELNYEDVKPILNKYLDKRFYVCTFK